MGWTYGKYLLDKERTASAFLYLNKRHLDKAKVACARDRGWRQAPHRHAGIRRKLARVEADLLALEWSVLRILAQEKNRYDAQRRGLGTQDSRLGDAATLTELEIDALGPLSLRRFIHDDRETIRSGDHAGRRLPRPHESLSLRVRRPSMAARGKCRRTSSPSPPSGCRREHMDFTLSDEQQMLRDGAERYLASTTTSKAPRRLRRPAGGVSTGACLPSSAGWRCRFPKTRADWAAASSTHRSSGNWAGVSCSSPSTNAILARASSTPQRQRCARRAASSCRASPTARSDRALAHSELGSRYELDPSGTGPRRRAGLCPRWREVDGAGRAVRRRPHRLGTGRRVRMRSF